MCFYRDTANRNLVEFTWSCFTSLLDLLLQKEYRNFAILSSKGTYTCYDALIVYRKKKETKCGTACSLKMCCFTQRNGCVKKHVNQMRFNRQIVKYGNSVRGRVIDKGERFGWNNFRLFKLKKQCNIFYSVPGRLSVFLIDQLLVIPLPSLNNNKITANPVKRDNYLI